MAAAQPGEVLMKVGDSVGVELPRGCLTGLCGACTCDIEEPLVGAENGFRAIARACRKCVCVCSVCLRVCSVCLCGECVCVVVFVTE